MLSIFKLWLMLKYHLRMLVYAAAILCLMPALALADDGSAGKSAALAVVLQVLTALALVVIPVLGAWLAKLAIKWFKTVESERNRQWIVKAAQGAAYLLEQVAEMTPTKVDDAAAEALRKVADQLGRELTVLEKDIAKAAFKRELNKIEESIAIRGPGALNGRAHLPA